MKDIFILENMAACKNFILEFIQKGYNEESFIGIGAFSSSSIPESDKCGAEIKITPCFLEQDLIDHIVQGHISVFEQEAILMQIVLKDQNYFFSKWLILNQHKSIFSLPKKEVFKYIKFTNDFSIEEFVSNYFNLLISKINEMRAQIAVILFDTDMFKSYLINFFLWMDKEFHSNKSNHINFLLNKNLIDRVIIKELFCFLSNVFFNNKIAIVPSKKEDFILFLNIAHEIKKELSLSSKDVMFRL